MSLWSRFGQFAESIGSGGAHLLDRISSAFSSSAGLSVAFTAAMIALSAKMAKADGIVTQDEVVAFREIVEIPEGQEKHVIRLFNLAQSDVAGFDVYARRIAALFPDEPETLVDIIDGLFHIAKADGVVHENELAFLEAVAEIFKIDSHRFRQIKARHIDDPTPDPYVILGITDDVGEAELKAQYRRLVSENHPDRLTARGVPEEFVKLANERLAAINGAWAQIRKERDF
ncbi:MAG: DnaJ family molecular chaperone [Pseudomonadota bacterium]